VTRLCVFCGSNPGTRPEYAETARPRGRAFADRRFRRVYGGGSIGLMGALADAVLDAGGEVIGVILVHPREFLRSKRARSLHVQGRSGTGHDGRIDP
jgi:predicted Rossmann-fold nucleotide-binding protein